MGPFRSERQEQVSETLLLTGVGSRRSWFVVAVEILLLLGALGAGGVVAVAAHFYHKYSQGLPSIPTVRAYHPPLLSELRSHDGRLLAEFFDERRKLIAYDRIPRRLIQAFVASEDKNFFDHHG